MPPLRFYSCANQEQKIEDKADTTVKNCPRCGMGVSAEAAFCDHCGAMLGPRRKVPWWHLHRRIYDWTLAWAYRPSAGYALFALSFAESSFFPVPPDVLLMPLVLGNRNKWFRFATICTTASVMGAFLGYALGLFAIQIALLIPGVTEEGIQWLQERFRQNGEVYVFIAALTPIPFKVLTIASGFSKLGILVFVAACLLGRSIRFYAVAGLMRLFGAKITPFIDKYFNWISLAFATLLVGGFLALKYLF